MVVLKWQGSWQGSWQGPDLHFAGRRGDLTQHSMQAACRAPRYVCAQPSANTAGLRSQHDDSAYQNLHLPRDLHDDLPEDRLGRSGAQPALVVALAKRHAPRAQDVVGGDGVEMEVWQREREEEGLRREGESARTDEEVEVPA